MRTQFDALFHHFLLKSCTLVIAPEQKARLTYDNILRLSDDPDVNNVIRFLREREIVHFQRFGEANHTDLSRFYPLQAAACRGYLRKIHSVGSLIRNIRQ